MDSPPESKNPSIPFRCKRSDVDHLPFLYRKEAEAMIAAGEIIITDVEEA